MNNLQEDLEIILEADEKHVSEISSDFLKKEARMIRGLAEDGESV